MFIYTFAMMSSTELVFCCLSLLKETYFCKQFNHLKLLL